MWHLKGKPLPVQAEATKRLLAAPRNRYGLWMDMGTGKTATALNHFAHVAFINMADVLLVVCPNSLKNNWIEECDKWGFRTKMCEWKEWTTWRVQKTPPVPVSFVMNYEAVLTKGAVVFFEALAKHRVHLVLDESQAVKNFQSQTSKTIREFAKGEHVRGVTLLSGTPMTQNPMDLYPQLRLLGEFDGKNPYAFRARYCKMGGFKGKQIVGINESTKDELIQITSRVSWRASKKDWLDLPEKSFVTRDVELLPDQKKLYKEMLNDFMIQVSGQEIPANMVISQLLKLQQIARGFVYDEGKSMVEITSVHKDPVLNEIMTVVNETEKVVIMCNFTASIDRITARMRDEKVPHSVLRGGMEQDAVTKAKDDFNRGPNKVLIGQLSAASKGHTLIGSPESPCFTLAFYENNYNLADRMQAEDRIHRQGQKNACLYLDFASSPIDRKIMKALQEKKFNVEQIVEALRNA